MEYKLIKPINPQYNAIEQILTNRNLPYHCINAYINTDDSIISSPLRLGMKPLKNAAAALVGTIQAGGKILVIIDSDCDGFTSSATLINYIYDLFPHVIINKQLEWFMHNGKQHGLSDCIEMILESDYQLVICPDSSSNDYVEHRRLAEKGIKVLVLDHHEAEKISEHAIIINNQLSDYPNKELSGVGVTWQFCRYIDMLLNTSYADKYIDLVSLGNMADMMSLLSPETKHLIQKGLLCITNPFFKGMVEKNEYSIGKEVTPMGVAFYVAPFINAIVRSGTQEEKSIVFRSMLTSEAFEKIPSTKRGHRLGEMETVVAQALRVATNVKARQTKAQDKGLEFLENMIEEQHLLDNKVLLFLLKPGQVDRNIAGLIANKFMAKYQRPCCILTEVVEQAYKECDFRSGIEIPYTKVSYQGSARGCDKVGITNFKDICAETGETMYEEGHQGAFGLGILQEKIPEFIESTNNALADMPDEAIYYVDYIFDGENVNKEVILDIGAMGSYWGKDMDESLVAIENLRVTENMVTLMSPDRKPTLKITLPNRTSIIKFNSSQEEYEQFTQGGYVNVNIVGTCNRNEWNGNITPQVLVTDYEIVNTCKYAF